MWNEQPAASKPGKPKIYSLKNIFLGIVTVFADNAGFSIHSESILPKRRKQIIVVDKLNIQSTEFKISGWPVVVKNT
jgi:hypothetical protein